MPLIKETYHIMTHIVAVVAVVIVHRCLKQRFITKQVIYERKRRNECITMKKQIIGIDKLNLVQTLRYFTDLDKLDLVELVYSGLVLSSSSLQVWSKVTEVSRAFVLTLSTVILSTLYSLFYRVRSIWQDDYFRVNLNHFHMACYILKH
jgi:hypothetical protein